MSAPQLSMQSLHLKRTFAAAREDVFRAWTAARELERWFAPSDDYRVVVPELDLRVGGAYRLEMHHKGGTVHRLTGIYREIKPPEKLAFSWRWESDPASGETLVTVEFLSVGDRTEIVLTHELFDSELQRDKHNHGWLACFEKFSRVYTG